MKTILGCVLASYLVVGSVIAGASQDVQPGPEERAELVKLQGAKPDVRRKAAERLGELKSRAAGPDLAKAATSDPDPSVRREAVLALGEIADRARVAEMIPVLKDSNEKVRGGAIEALVNVYIDRETGFFSSVRHVAVVATPFWDERQRSTVEPYDPVDPAVTTGIADLLKSDTSRDNRIAAVRALGALRAGDHIDGLADAMAADARVRSDVLNSYVLIGDPVAARYAIPLFDNEDNDVATQAMFTAGRLRAREAVTPLLTVYGTGGRKTGVVGSVKDPFAPNRKKAALEALALIGDPSAHQVFTENMSNKDGDMRTAAFEGLAREADPRFGDMVARYAQIEKSDDVRLAQTFALYKMGRPGMMSVLIQALDNGSRRDQAAAYVHEAHSQEDLLPYIRVNDSKAQLVVVDALGDVGDAKSVEALKPFVHGASPDLALIADRSIRRIEWRTANPPSEEAKPVESPSPAPATEPATPPDAEVKPPNGGGF